MRKNSPKISRVGVPVEYRSEFEKLAETPGWRIVGQEELPQVLPERFREKIDSAVVISSATMSSDRTYLVCNALRVDEKAGAIDHEPFAISVFPSGSSTGGIFVHHGDWTDRSTPAPDGFWETVEESGIGDYFLANPPSNKTSGTLEELDAGHRAAFYRAVGLLQDEEGR